VQRARGGEAATPSAGEIEEALDSVDLAALRALAEAAHGARADALAIEAVLRERSGVALTLDFDPLHKALAEIDTLASDWLARRPVPEDGVDADGSEAGAEADPAIVETSSTSADTPRARMPADPIANREDALRVLDDVSRWFRRHEPSHPVPILLERARRWIEMDFMDLLRDVAPEAVVQAEKLHGAIRAE
jgi:type VI secretion system protein ImpA